MGGWMKQAPVYLTAAGLEKLKEEYDQLVNVRRPALAKRLRRAIQQGDLSENADYITAKEEQGFLEGRIQQIDEMLRHAVVIQENGPTDVVGLGSRVTVREEEESQPEVFQLVGPAEANPGDGRISYESPLGQALLGRQVGETVRVETPAGAALFQIVAID